MDEFDVPVIPQIGSLRALVNQNSQRIPPIAAPKRCDISPLCA